MSNDTIFTAQFTDARSIDTLIQLPAGQTISDIISSEDTFVRNARIFCDLAALYQEDERVKALMDRYDIVITAENPEPGQRKPVILFETVPARIAREKQSAHGS